MWFRFGTRPVFKFKSSPIVACKRLAYAIRRPASLADSVAAATRHTIRILKWHKFKKWESCLQVRQSVGSKSSPGATAGRCYDGVSECGINACLVPLCTYHFENGSTRSSGNWIQKQHELVRLVRATAHAC